MGDRFIQKNEDTQTILTSRGQGIVPEPLVKDQR